MFDIIKALILVGAYFFIGPLGGYILSRDKRMEDFCIYVLMFLLGLHINTTVLMLGSIDWYRGVTKGYEFTMMEILSISLIFASLFAKDRKFVWLPKGTLLWGLYVGASSLSLITALNSNYVFMSILKFGKVWLIVYAIANYVRSRKDVHHVLTGLAIMLMYQFLIVAKMKWIDGFHQVPGLFEHQNPLAMFTYMAALPVLGAALSPAVGKARSLFYLLAFACSSIIVLATLSRGAMAIFAVGVVGVVAWGYLDRFTIRRVLTVFLLALGGMFVLAMTFDTIISRFNDMGNETSAQTREVMAESAEAMLNDKFFGVGWNNFGMAINSPYPYSDAIDQWNIDRGKSVDNDYAKGVVESHYWLLKAENGYLGYLSYMLFIIVITAPALILMILRRGSLEAAVASGIFIGFTLTYLHSDLERVLTQTKNLALWMTLIGLLGAMHRLPKKPAPRNE